MNNETLKEQAIVAIENLFYDKSVSLEMAIENMEELEDMINLNISALREDIRNQNND